MAARRILAAPAFWWGGMSLAASLLSPIGLVYGAIAAARMRRQGTQPPVPVICIGNFTLGGSGKTPVALAVADILQKAGRRPAFLTRGYGGSLRGPLAVEPHHQAGEVGDEPLLLSQRAPTFVSADRVAGAKMAATSGALTIVMDDGMQNPSLTKTLTLAVVDGETGVGNGLSFPAGPLRAPLKKQWPHVDALVLVGSGKAGEVLAAQASSRGKPVFRGRFVPDMSQVGDLVGKRVLAFAGIGRPEKFFQTLREAGAKVEIAIPYPDHHVFTTEDLAAIDKEAKRHGLVPITTEKDAARLESTLRATLRTLPIRLAIDDEKTWREFILSRI